MQKYTYRGRGGTALANRIRGSKVPVHLIIASDVESIPAELFKECSPLKTLTAHDKLKTIGHSAFYQCSNLSQLRDIQSVVTVGAYAFGFTQLELVDFPNATGVDNYAFVSCAEINCIKLPKATTIGNNAFSGCMKVDPSDSSKFIVHHDVVNNQEKYLDRHLLEKKLNCNEGATKQPAKEEGGEEDDVEEGVGEEDVEEADEITYTSYKPQKLKFGVDHPDPVVENSTLSAVVPPEVEYNLAMPADILYKGKLSNLQLEAIVYGCQRHLIDLPVKEDTSFDGGEVVVEKKPARAGFLLGDGAGMGKGRTLAGFVIENLARGRKRHVWISVNADLYEDAKRDLRDLELGSYAETHCYNLGKLPYGDLTNSHPEGVMFATYSTLISKNRQKQTRLDQLIEWCGGEDFDGLVMLDECHKAKTIELDANGNPKTEGRGAKKRDKSSQTAKNVVNLQQALPRARVVYCSATSVSHPKNLGFMSRLGLWGPGTEHPSGFNQFLDGLKRLGTGAMEIHAMHLKSIGALCARTLSYESCEFELVDCISDEKVSTMYNKASEIWTALHSQLLDRYTKLKRRDEENDKIQNLSEKYGGELTAEMHYHLELHKDSDTESDNDDDDKMVEERRLRRTYRERKAKNLLGLFWSAHQRFFLSLCIASKVDTAITLAKKALDDGNCCVIGLQSTGEARSKGAAAAAGINDDAGGSFEDFVSAPNEDLKRIIMVLFPLPPKPRGVIAPVFLNVNKSKDDDGDTGDGTNPTEQRFKLGTILSREFEDPSTGKMRMYEGTVMKYFNDEELYQVEYEDGDSEDMTEEDVASCVNDDESEAGTSAGRSSRSARRKKVNYSEINDDCDGNKRSSNGTKRKPSNKRGKAANKKRRGTTGAKSVTNSDDESDFEVEQDNDDVDEMDADDDCDTTGSKKRPARGKSKKDKGPIKRIQWDEIDLNLDTSASVENERMVEYRKACEKVKGWLDDVDDLTLPANPLDRLLNELGGPEKVAELTGRKIRQIRRFDESKGKMVVFYEKRKGTGRLDQINVEERNNFQSGKKLVAILSEAASTGISLQADKRVGNQKRRVHITLELPWSADKAIQQLGRTHRANQTSGPMYKFLISDVGGEKRFAAAVAKRLALLGALTQGDRRATGQSNALGLGGFDFDNKFGSRALKKMLREIWECNKNCISDAPGELVIDALKVIDSHLSEALDQTGPGTWEDNLAPYSDDAKSEQDHYKMMQTLLVRKCPQVSRQRVKAIGEGRSVVKYLQNLLDGTETKEAIKPKIDEEVKAAMEAGLNFNVLCNLWLFDVGITEQTASGETNYFKKGKPMDVPKFLNRTLGMNLLRQKLIVDHFIKHLGKQVTLAKREGTYDLGIQTIGGHSVVIEKPRSFCFRGLDAKDERVLLFKVKLDRGMDAETALQLFKDVEAPENADSSASTIGAGSLFGGNQVVRIIKSGFYIDRRDIFKEVPRMFLIINQGRASSKCVVVRPNEGKKIFPKEFVWNKLLHGEACRLTPCNDIDQAMVTWKKEFDLADRPDSERYQRYCYGRHTDSCIFGGDIIPILNKILASTNPNGIGMANSDSLSMPDVVRVESPGKTPEDDAANAVNESSADDDEEDSSESPAVGHKVARQMLGNSVFRGAITEVSGNDPESFVATFTDGSVVEMSIDEANKARRLFDTEWSKLVVDADVPKAVASSIEVHNAVNSEAQKATRRPFLSAEEEKTTNEYEKIFEEEYDGDVPNVLVGLEFPKRELSWFSQSVNDYVYIPSWQFVLRKLAERLSEEGTPSSRELFNLENAQSIKLGATGGDSIDIGQTSSEESCVDEEGDDCDGVPPPVEEIVPSSTTGADCVAVASDPNSHKEKINRLRSTLTSECEAKISDHEEKMKEANETSSEVEAKNKELEKVRVDLNTAEEKAASEKVRVRANDANQTKMASSAEKTAESCNNDRPIPPREGIYALPFAAPSRKRKASAIGLSYTLQEHMLPPIPPPQALHTAPYVLYFGTTVWRIPLPIPMTTGKRTNICTLCLNNGGQYAKTCPGRGSHNHCLYFERNNTPKFATSVQPQKLRQRARRRCRHCSVPGCKGSGGAKYCVNK